MIYLPTEKISFKKDVELHFPDNFCCNCGEKTSLKCVEQDTRLTTYLFGGGSEITFKLPLPFCKGCLSSSKRRPKSIFHRMLLFVVACAIIASALVAAGSFFDGFLPPEYIAPTSFLISSVFMIMLLISCRPKDRQTSYFQPVVIRKLKREFISGAITKIFFSFTNKEYARLFSMENKKAIAEGALEVRSI